MSIVEGSGNFECTAACHADRPFKTTNLKEYNEHQQTEGHIFVNGWAECSNCNTSYHYDVLYAGTKPVCDKCGDNISTKTNLGDYDEFKGSMMHGEEK